MLEQLDAARAGRGSALVITGGVGSGKTSLLAAAPTAGFRVLKTAGVPAESALDNAGLHLLLQQLSGRLPEPLRLATGLVPATGSSAATFVLNTEVHRLLCELADEQPLLVLVDDAGLLDRSSLEALAFAARRVSGHRLAILFALEAPRGESPLTGLPQLALGPLDDTAATELLSDHHLLGLSEDFAEEVLDLAGGNPLALTELARTGELPADSALRARVRARFQALSPDTRQLVLLAVADEDLELDSVVRADLRPDALEEARDSGLLVVRGKQVEVSTRLTRSVLRTEVPYDEHRQAHEVLAAVLDPEQHTARWLWHRGAVSKEVVESHASELGAAAGRSRRTGDYPASSLASERAASLAGSPQAKAAHLIAAAADQWSMGQPRRSRAILREAAPHVRGRELRGLAEFVRGGIELGDSVPGTAVRSLLKASDELLDSHRELAVTALVFAAEAGSIAGDPVDHAATAARAAQLRRPDEPPAIQLMFDHLEGMAATFAGRHVDARPALDRAVRLATDLTDPRSKIWGSQAAYVLGRANRSMELATQAVAAARDTGMTSLVPWALVYKSLAALLLDQHSISLDSSLEGVREATAMWQPNTVVDHLTILALTAALQGDKTTAVHRLHLAAADVARRGLGRPSTFSSWTLACVDLVDNRPADALNRLRLLAVDTGRVHPGIKVMTAPHFVEAAVACGRPAKAASALRQYEDWATGTGCPARLALSHRSHALLAGTGAGADEYFREAIRLHRVGGTPMELAKTELFYGHRLRRDRQPKAAREHLRDALRIFQQYGSEHFVDLVRAELRASGDTIEPTRTAAAAELTAQQSQIAHLVAEGATNREIAAQLFISHRTVEHHLRNIFARLEVRSRVELARLLG